MTGDIVYNAQLASFRVRITRSGMSIGESNTMKITPHHIYEVIGNIHQHPELLQNI